MIQRLLQALLVPVIALGFGLGACAVPPQPTLGADAPAIEASTWFNHEGPAPSLESLNGKAILLEFWATW